MKTHDLEHLLDELTARQCGLLTAIEPLCDALAEVYFVDRYPGFDLDDPDWPKLRQQITDVGALLIMVKARVTPTI